MRRMLRRYGYGVYFGSFLAILMSAPAFAQASASVAAGRVAPDIKAPSEIVAAAPAADWVAIPPTDVLVMDLVGERRVVIERQRIGVQFQAGETHLFGGEYSLA